jgi:membrane protein YdbS with pleckstrin-like domain
VSYLKKLLPNSNNERLFPFFVVFCVAGFGVALGFTAFALSAHWLALVAFFITVLGVLAGFLFIVQQWWRSFRGASHKVKDQNVQ